MLLLSHQDPFHHLGLGGEVLQSKGPFLVAFSVLWGLRARLRLALWGLRGGPLSGAPWKVGRQVHPFLTCFLILRTEGLGTNRKMDATNFPSGSLKRTLQLGTEMALTSGDSIVNNPQKETVKERATLIARGLSCSTPSWLLPHIR